MARRKGWLDVRRKKQGILWWLFIGWWERPLAGVMWLMLANLCGNRGVKYHYYQ